MRGIGLVAASSLLVAAGCVHETRMSPAAGAQVQQGDKNAARAEAGGVLLVASGNAWKGEPQHLEESLLPVRVLLENHSGRPLRLEYRLFTLIGGQSRFQYAAVPPLETGRSPLDRGMGGSGPQTMNSRAAAGAYGQVDPHSPFVGSYGPYYPEGSATSRQCVEPLPSPDMLEQALPEGTLIDGGRVDGFLFFQGVAERESQVVLQAHLVDGNTGEPFGTLDIPFQVQKP